MPGKTTISFSSQWQTKYIWLSFPFITFHHVKLRLDFKSETLRVWKALEWPPGVCKCLTWWGFTKFANAPFPGLTRHTNHGRQCVCVCGEGGTKYSWNWLMHYVGSWRLWSLPSLGVYHLSCIHDVKYNNSLTKMKEWWNKVLGDSWSNIHFFLLCTSIHKTNWEENLAIYQKSLGESLRRNEDVKKLDH